MVFLSIDYAPVHSCRFAKGTAGQKLFRQPVKLMRIMTLIYLT